MFERCCADRREFAYQVRHDPIPLALEPSMKAMIDKLLWYVPNIDSYQSISLDIITDDSYDNLIFDFLLSGMHMQESDVQWLNKNEEVAVDDWDYYKGKVCTACQKAIMCSYVTQTKTQNLLRNIRNCIAHGEFTVIGDMLVAFNTHSEKRKAVIKIKPALLLQTLEQIPAQYSQTAVKAFFIAEAFKKVGYDVTADDSERRRFRISQNGSVYQIEVKECSDKYLRMADAQPIFEAAGSSGEDMPRVLVFDKCKVVKEVHAYSKTTGSVIFLGRYEMKELLAGKDILKDMMPE